MKILVTGGAGYIGSITNRLLCDHGYETVVFDNLSTGHKDSVQSGQFIQGDLNNKKDIEKAFELHKFDAVVHFAAKALAGESMQRPEQYIENNVMGGTNLLDTMRRHGCSKFIFSSTCAVYGYPKTLPVTEEESIKPVSVYGASKYMFESILHWYSNLFDIKYVALRYFNACGALSNDSLEEAHPAETHIIPLALDVALGKKKVFSVYGNDYHTPDGTCIRDYIHVSDFIFVVSITNNMLFDRCWILY
jgi:UDP-glucose 4-epimerase